VDEHGRREAEAGESHPDQGTRSVLRLCAPVEEQRRQDERQHERRVEHPVLEEELEAEELRGEKAQRQRDELGQVPRLVLERAREARPDDGHGQERRHHSRLERSQRAQASDARDRGRREVQARRRVVEKERRTEIVPGRPSDECARRRQDLLEQVPDVRVMADRVVVRPDPRAEGAPREEEIEEREDGEEGALVLPDAPRDRGEAVPGGAQRRVRTRSGIHGSDR
jgi:hypothetical protein